MLLLLLLLKSTPGNSDVAVVVVVVVVEHSCTPSWQLWDSSAQAIFLFSKRAYVSLEVSALLLAQSF